MIIYTVERLPQENARLRVWELSAPNAPGPPQATKNLIQAAASQPIVAMARCHLEVEPKRGRNEEALQQICLSHNPQVHFRAWMEEILHQLGCLLVTLKPWNKGILTIYQLVQDTFHQHQLASYSIILIANGFSIQVRTTRAPEIVDSRCICIPSQGQSKCKPTQNT